MQQTRLIMGMPITVYIPENATPSDFSDVFTLFKKVDSRFSPYKKDSEVAGINRKEVSPERYSDDMKEVLHLAEMTRGETDGYFDVYRNGYFDPSGIVKGWAIRRAAGILERKGHRNFYIDAGGDIQATGQMIGNKPWRIGIRHPFDLDMVVKTIKVRDRGIATSGTYLRGAHIYNPKQKAKCVDEIVSLTIIGPDILHADRFATAAFAMGKRGIEFIDSLPGYEGYMIDRGGIAVSTQGFDTYVVLS